MTHNNLLELVEKQEIVAKRFGFYWETIQQLLEQIRSECVEIEEAYQKNDRRHLQEEIGDLLQAAASLAVFCDLDPNETLQKSCEKFQKRYDALVSMVLEDGLPNLHNQSFDTMMLYWKGAKNLRCR